MTTAAQSQHPQDNFEARATPLYADQRLNETIDFGASLEEIATKFKARMDEFTAIDGAGPDKFLDLGAHVYACCARSLDMFLANNESAQEHRGFAQSVSMRLKRLADYGP